MAHLYKRGRIYYVKYYRGRKQKEKSLRTDSLQVAKERKRELESALAAGGENPLPTRTPLPEVLSAYVEHIRAVKTPKAAQSDIYYLREAFGPICDPLTITSRTPSREARKKRPKISRIDRRRRLPVIEANAIEEITTRQIADFIDFKVRDQGLKPKTANHYRSIIRRVFNWASQRGIIRVPGNVNPAAQVQPYKEHAPEIRFLTLPQINEQLDVLRFKPQLQAMVAVLIYAGLRREELTWLTLDDIDLSRRSGGRAGRGSTAAGHGMIGVRAKTIDGRSWQPKTKVNRAVPISRALREHLDRYTPRATVDPKVNNTSGGFRGWFFPSPEGRWWDPDNFSADLRQANREAGLQWTSLDYRHTFGSHLAQNGVSLYKISTLLGNSPEICRRHYAVLVSETMAEEVEFGTHGSEPSWPKECSPTG